MVTINSGINVDLLNERTKQLLSACNRERTSHNSSRLHSLEGRIQFLMTYPTGA